MAESRMDSRLDSLKKHGSNSISYLTLWDGLSIFHGEWEGYIAHKDRLRVSVVLGDPVVPVSEMKKAVGDLKDHFKSRGSHICFFACTEKTSRLLIDEGFKCLYIGSEAVVDLEEFSLAGGRMHSVRSSVNYARRHNLVMEEYVPENGRDESIEQEVMYISQDWCTSQRIPELRFMIGKLNFEITEGKRYFLCRHEDKAVSFIVYYPVFATGDYYLDLMRRRKDAPRGCMDFLLAESFDQIVKEGVGKIYLGFSPFSFLNSPKNANPHYANSLFTFLSDPFEFFYPAQSEFMFKNKFATSWEPNYLCYYPRLTMRGLFAILDAFCPGGLGSILSHKAKMFTRSRSSRTPKGL
ncbi:MAG: DUF2156 domain-containing protein [Thermoplasmata archaeon]